MKSTLLAVLVLGLAMRTQALMDLAALAGFADLAICESACDTAAAAGVTAGEAAEALAESQKGDEVVVVAAADRQRRDKHETADADAEGDADADAAALLAKCKAKCTGIPAGAERHYVTLSVVFAAVIAALF